MRLLVFFLLLAAPSLASAQLGDPTPVIPRATVVVEAPPDHREPRPDLSGQIATTVIGGAVTLAGVGTLVVAGFNSFGSIDSLSEELVWVGSFASAIGVGLLFGGLAWLLDTVDRDPEQARADPPGVFRF